MDKITPIKRSEELQPLSRDHHSGLLLCWKIRMGMEMGTAPKRIADYVVFYYNSHLESHFREEELYVFTLVAANDAMVKKAMDDHREIEQLVKQLKSNTVDYTHLSKFEKLLNKHIRYEERELFSYIEINSDNSGLKKAGEIIAGLHSNVSEPAWADDFWVKIK